MVVKAKTDEAPATTPEASTPPEEPKAEPKKASSKGGKKADSGEQLKAETKARDLVDEVVKAYRRIDEAKLAKAGQLDGPFPSLKAEQVVSTRLDAEGTLFAVTENGQKLQVVDGDCTILAGPGYVSEAFLPPVKDST